MPIKPTSRRPDRRYKNPNTAPDIISEKRLTFFLTEDAFRALRLHSGLCQINNAQDADAFFESLPETPSALCRIAVDYWLDQFRPARERTRTDAEWEEMLRRMRAALRA